MPNKDKTGPNGQGPITGRGLGLCGNGLGMRRDFGRGRGFGRGRCPAKFLVGFTKAEEKKILESELKEIETQKQSIAKRMKELK